MKDFIIVGNGLSALVLAHRFFQKGISFALVGNSELSSCSRVAAGIWNPVVFKRMSKSWLAEELLQELNEFYSTCEKQLNTKFVTRRPIIKPFVEEQEKVLWQKKAKTDLQAFIDEHIYEDVPNEFQNCKISNGFSYIKESGNVDVKLFLEHSLRFFYKDVLNETFDYTALQNHDLGISYKTIHAKNILFCEGYLVKDNPYFSWLPLKPVKGEVMTIHTTHLRFKNSIFNKNGFLLDIGSDCYKVGATYNWSDVSENTTETGLEELKTKLKEMSEVPYQLMKHEVGVRPSSIDRRPIIGPHPVLSNYYVFNGMGTKGVMLAPYFAKKFVLFFLQKETLPHEVNVSRFYEKHFRE